MGDEHYQGLVIDQRVAITELARDGRFEEAEVIAKRAQELAPHEMVTQVMVTKSGIMVGLGETMGEILGVFRDLASRGVDILTVGQYLRPSKDHLPIARFYSPEEFLFMKIEALRFGFRHVESGPLVRSSYHAHEQADSTCSPPTLQ